MALDKDGNMKVMGVVVRGMKSWHAGWVLGGVLLLAGCSDSPNGQPAPSPTSASANAAATYTATATATVLPANSGPVVRTYARGEAVDVQRGTVFFDPKTGGGEAWADVGVSPLGIFAPWYGADVRQPPVLYETLTRRRVELDAGGQPGMVLNFSPDEAEVAFRVGGEVRIASTRDGSVRLRFTLPAETFFARADWGPQAGVAVTSSAKDQKSLGVIVSSGGSMKAFPNVPDNWTKWSPNGIRLLVSGIEGPDGWLAIVDLGSGEVTRVEQALLNPNWSASGRYFAGQLVSGELLVFRADGAPVLRMNGVCALVSSPWLGDEVVAWGFGEDALVAMDGTVSAYSPPAPTGPRMDLRADGSAALVDAGTGAVLAELRPGPGVVWAGYFGFPWVTPDGRGKLQLGAGGKGACENVGMFSVELLSSARP